MAKYRILVADDSAQIRKILCKMFSNHDKLELCDEAINGQDAVDKARVCAPDLVVLDLSMPVMNGLEAARIIRGFLPTVPIILFTMHASVLETTHGTPPAITRVVSKTEIHKLPQHALEVLAA
jgi:chemotaxis response regulator CheB